jgi:hypothetical protein
VNEAEARLAGISFESALDKALPLVVGKPAQLRQVVSNLIDNVMEVMRPAIGRRVLRVKSQSQGRAGSGPERPYLRAVLHDEARRQRRRSGSMSRNLMDEPLIGAECLELLGMKDHPLAHKLLRDATREDLQEAAKLHERAATEAKRRAGALKLLYD